MSGTFVTKEIWFSDDPWISMSKHRLNKAQAKLHTLFVFVCGSEYLQLLSHHLYQWGSLCDVLKELGVSLLRTAAWRASEAPSALAPWLRDIWRHSQDKINKNMPLKSSHWHSTIYFFPMGHQSNGCSLRSSMKALYSMSSSTAYLPLAINQHPWSL